MGRKNGKDAEVADSGARGSNWSRESTGLVAEAHCKVAVIGGCRGGWILVTAPMKVVLVWVGELRNDGQGDSLAGCEPLGDNA